MNMPWDRSWEDRGTIVRFIGDDIIKLAKMQNELFQNYRFILNRVETAAIDQSEGSLSKKLRRANKDGVDICIMDLGDKIVVKDMNYNRMKGHPEFKYPQLEGDDWIENLLELV